MQNYRGQRYRSGCEDNYRNNNFGRGRSRSREDIIQVILEGMIEAVADQDQVQEQVIIKIELDVLNVENMTISLMTVLTQRWKENQSKYSKCTI